MEHEKNSYRFSRSFRSLVITNDFLFIINATAFLYNFSTLVKLLIHEPLTLPKIHFNFFLNQKENCHYTIIYCIRFENKWKSNTFPFFYKSKEKLSQPDRILHKI